MARFHTLPVSIEAFRLPTEAGFVADEAFHQWAGTHGMIHWQSHVGGGISISTLEGTMFAEPGDWIIKGVAGEFYPCKPDIFQRTYETEPSPADLPGRSGVFYYRGERVSYCGVLWVCVRVHLSNMFGPVLGTTADWRRHVWAA